MNPFSGVNMFIWQMRNCTPHPSQSSEARAYLISTMQALKVSTAYVKVADGVGRYNLREEKGKWYDDILPPLFDAFRASNIPAVGWQYLYGDDPIREADRAHEQIQSRGLTGYILDPEGQYKRPNMATAARQFMNRLRQLEPDIPVALCSYRFPTWHPQLPWAEFLRGLDASRGDCHMPQVYWEGQDALGVSIDQVQRSYSELMALEKLPFAPAGPLYRRWLWYPSAQQIRDFGLTTAGLGGIGVSFWSWENLAKWDGWGPLSAEGGRGWWNQVYDLAHLLWQDDDTLPAPLTLEQRVENLETWARGHGATLP